MEGVAAGLIWTSIGWVSAALFVLGIYVGFTERQWRKGSDDER